MAKPNRPAHRNDHLKTAKTHVTSTAGYWFVHQDGEVLELDGVRAEGLSYDEARRFKDYAVTKHKKRQAGIKRHDDDWTPGAPETVDADLTAEPDSVTTPSSPPNPDPQLEQARQRAMAAARPVAQAAQAKHDKAKNGKQPQRAPGWEPPPAGATGARQAPKPPAKDAPVVRAPGFEAPSGGKKSAAPDAVAVVEIDPIPDGDDNLEIEDGGDEVADLVSGGGDLETEVKRKVEETDNKVIEACKAIKPGDVVYYYPDDTSQEYAAVAQVHAPTCVSIQLGVTEDMIEVIHLETEPVQDVVTLKTPPEGAVLRSVMLAPKEGKRANTWSPIL